MRKFFPYVLCGVMAVAFSSALGQSSDAKKNDPQVKRQGKKQADAKQEEAAKRAQDNERSAAPGGSVKKEDLDDDGKNKKEKD
jgi:hypothetical protein